MTAEPQNKPRKKTTQYAPTGRSIFTATVITSHWVKKVLIRIAQKQLAVNKAGHKTYIVGGNERMRSNYSVEFCPNCYFSVAPTMPRWDAS